MRYRGKSRIWQLVGVAAIAAIGKSEEKHEPASDINTVVVDEALQPKRPIREADIEQAAHHANSPRRKLGQWPPG